MVEHIADTKLVARGDRIRITDTEVIKLIDVCHALLKIVYLINNKHDRLVGTPQHVRHLRICIDQSLLAVYHKHNNVCRIDRDLRLIPHLG